MQQRSAAAFTAHSLRPTLPTALACFDADAQVVQQQGHWRTRDMLLKYDRSQRRRAFQCVHEVFSRFQPLDSAALADASLDRFSQEDLSAPAPVPSTGSAPDSATLSAPTALSVPRHALVHHSPTDALATTVPLTVDLAGHTESSDALVTPVDMPCSAEPA